jgi:serine/threonine protein kinase
MPTTTSSNILTLSNTQAKKLAGNLLTIGERTYRFKDYDPAFPGQPPWRSGAEGKAYPLLDPAGSVDAYLKFFTRPTPRRLSRTAWLISQQMQNWLPNLAAAPLLWADTRNIQRPAGLNFDFTAYLAQAVPGETWLELKNRIKDGKTSLPEEIRWRCLSDLVLAAAVLEQAELVHGDLSPNNIVIDLAAEFRQPLLYFIDFDAFVAKAAGKDRLIFLADGGTYGTEGYCPPDLSKRAGAGDVLVAPYSDRYARDMLLLELLLMDHGFSSDDPPAAWNPDRLHRCYAALRARGDQARWRNLNHLEPPKVFALSERERPTSVELASGLGLSMPPRPILRPAAPLGRAVVSPTSWHSSTVSRTRKRTHTGNSRQPTSRSPGVQQMPSVNKYVSAQPQTHTTGQWLDQTTSLPQSTRQNSRHFRLPSGPSLWKNDDIWITVTIVCILLFIFLTSLLNHLF